MGYQRCAGVLIFIESRLVCHLSALGLYLQKPPASGQQDNNDYNDQNDQNYFCFHFY